MKFILTVLDSLWIHVFEGAIVLISHNLTLLAVQALRCLLSLSTQGALQDYFQNHYRIYRNSGQRGHSKRLGHIAISQNLLLLYSFNMAEFGNLFTSPSQHHSLPPFTRVLQCRTSEVYSKVLWRMKCFQMRVYKVKLLPELLSED